MDLEDLAEFRRAEWQGEEYLVHDVVAQREGIYEYPDDRHGITRELVRGETLTDPQGDWEGKTLVLRHPESEDGDHLTVNDGVPITDVGAFRNVSPTDDEDGPAGEVWIRADEVGQHDGDLEGYIESIESGEFGEVSTGYTVSEFDDSGGRYNGQRYDREQVSIRPDHLALLPDEIGNCPISAGCGVGRANSDSSEAVRVNRATPDVAPADADADRLGDALAETIRRFLPARRNDTDDEAEGGDEPAESGSDTDPTDPDRSDGSDDSMDDSEKIKILVEEHGYDRENLEAWEGEDCLSRLFETETAEKTAVDAEEDEEGVDDETPEEELTPDGSVSMDDPDAAEAEDVDTEEVTVNKADLKEAFEEFREEERRQEAKSEHVDTLATNDEAPFERDELERMNADALETLVDKFDTDGAAEAPEAPRANYAGRPTGQSAESTRANAEHDESESAPTAGYDSWASRQESDD